MKMKKAAGELSVILRAHAEWFCVAADEEARPARPTPLAPGDWTLTKGHGQMLFSYWGEYGLQTWRVASWGINDQQIILRASRPTGPETKPQRFVTLILTPRVSVRKEIEMLREARLAALARFVALTRQTFPRAAVLRAALSRSVRSSLLPGREARVVLRQPNGDHVALTGVVDAAAGGGRAKTGALLSSALLWFGRLSRTLYYRNLILVCAPAAGDPAEELLRLVALLRGPLRRAVQLYETGDGRDMLTPLTPLDRSNLYDSAPRLSLSVAAPKAPPSAWCERVAALAPEAIDVVRARHGESLRFRGLAFARVRRVMDQEHAWFGVSPSRRIVLTEDTWPELVKLVEALSSSRRADAADHRHAFFAAAGEAWLESLLRRDITRLDPNLIASPLHAQLRAAGRGGKSRAAPSRPIDLCGLRHDGRLVLIELKVAADRELIFQGMDYWWRVETLRRRGALDRAALFGGGRKIVDAPPLLYLVAPLLSFHPAFAELAAAVDPLIEIYRFDLNEDWRAGVRVARRVRVN